MDKDQKKSAIDKIGIIGGNGSMGGWFKNFFEHLHYDVMVSDIGTEITNRQLAGECRVVILSTPIDAAIEIASDIGPFLKKEQILMDFCSQKEDIVNAMLKYSQSEVVGIHPMFGPFTDSIRAQNIVLCHGRGEFGFFWIKNVFSGAGAEVTQFDPVDHDRHMALVQGLTHFITICMARTLQKMDLHPNEAFSVSTPIFRINSDIMGRLFAQDPDLYTTLVGENKYVNDVLALFTESFEETKSSLIKGRHEQGVDFIKNIGVFLGDYRKIALERSNEFLNILFR
jgi:prephenate dehydrogenase